MEKYIVIYKNKVKIVDSILDVFKALKNFKKDKKDLKIFRGKEIKI